MENGIVGRKIFLSPLEGESDIDEELEGRIEGLVRRTGFNGTYDYFLVKLAKSFRCAHPGLKRTLEIHRVLVWPDDTRLEWAFSGGGPQGLPVLVKIFGVIPQSESGLVDYSSGETFLLARGIAKAQGAK